MSPSKPKKEGQKEAKFDSQDNQMRELQRRNRESKLKHTIAKRLIMQEFDSLYPKPSSSGVMPVAGDLENTETRQTRAAQLVADTHQNMVYSMKEEVRGSEERRTGGAKDCWSEATAKGNIPRTHIAAPYSSLRSQLPKKLELSLQKGLRRLRDTVDMARRRADVDFLLHEVMKQLQRTLRGCDIYYSLLQPGGDVIKVR